jgi:hypothetical protein
VDTFEPEKPVDLKAVQKRKLTIWKANWPSCASRWPAI